MKWPENPRVSEDTAAQLHRRIAEFILEDESPDGGSDGEAVRQLILDLYSIFSAKLGPDEGGARLKDLIARAREWDTDEPPLAHAQKYINRLFDGRVEDAYVYIDRAVADRAADAANAGRAAMASAGSLGGKTKQSEHKAAKEAALKYYDQHQGTFATKKEAARTLERLFPPMKFATLYRILRSL